LLGRGEDLPKSIDSIMGSLEVLTTAVAPAKTPMLMAMPTPIFSLRFICRPQRNFHGSKASVMSIRAEYPPENMP
jgi:hypothetical protein